MLHLLSRLKLYDNKYLLSVAETYDYAKLTTKISILSWKLLTICKNKREPQEKPQNESGEVIERDFS